MALVSKTAKMSSGFFLLLTLIHLTLADVTRLKRTLTSAVNPQCNLTACQTGVNGSYVNLFYTRADGQNDTLHYIASSLGTPSLLMALTDRDVELDIDWSRFISDDKAARANSISFSHQPQYVYAMLFPRLLEYNDVDDKAIVGVASENNSVWHDFSDFNWDDISIHHTTDSADAHARVVFTASSVSDSSNTTFSYNGSLSFQFDIFAEDGRESLLPHLLYNANSSQLSFSIDHMTPRYQATRYALEVVMVTPQSKTMQLNVVPSIDDEYTPGIFQSITWTAEADVPSAYMQWKPVCYRDKERNFQNGTKAKHTYLQNYTVATSAVLFGYYGSRLHGEAVIVRALNVSFGLSEDKFYAGTMYISWSATIGFGSIIYDQVSPLIIIIITTGLGLPVLIILFGGIGVCIKKQRNKSIKVMSDFTSSQPTIN